MPPVWLIARHRILEASTPARLNLGAVKECARGKYCNPKRKKNCPRADLYNILQVPASASKGEIKAAYRQLSKKRHPDLNKHTSASAYYQAVHDAYKVLSNDELRHRYDRLGFVALGPQYAKYNNPEWQVREHGIAKDGKDVVTILWLDLVEAALGTERIIQVRVARSCPQCKGCTSHAQVQSFCPVCRGHGDVTRKIQSHAGLTRQKDVCPLCGGTGARTQQWCQDCGGSGLKRVLCSLRVRVPPGVDDESMLRLRGSGDEGKFGGACGDLFVNFVIRSNYQYSRSGHDLHSKVSVAYTDAILGSVYKVQTIRGQADLTIPPGTQHGELLSLPGYGIQPGIHLREKGMKGIAGSHVYEVVLRLPLAVSTEEREILEKLTNVS